MLLVLALGLAPAAGALPLEKDPAEATPSVREAVATPTPPPVSSVRSALVAFHLDELAEQAAKAARAVEAAKAAPPPAAPIADERVRIRFQGMQPLPVNLDVGMMTGVANGLLVPRPDFLVPHVAAPADDGIERLRPLAQR